MADKSFWQGLKDRADQLRRGAEETKRKAGERRAALPELALAASDLDPREVKAFDEASAKIEALLSDARRAELVAQALDAKAEEAKRKQAESDRLDRLHEMDDARRGHDHAVREMDRALADLEDALTVLRDARNDYVGALRRAGFTDAAATLARRASQMLAMSLWANAPGVAKALGVEGRFRHHARSMADAVGFLPDSKEDEQR